MIENDEDLYKKTFKLYKNLTHKSNLPLIDLSDENSVKCMLNDGLIRLEEQSINDSSNLSEICETYHHFKPFEQWKLYRINNVDGLLIIPSILREQYRLEWFEYFHKTLPLLHQQLNLKANIDFSCNNNDGDDDKSPLENIRWITFGYHHNWDTKHYQLDQSVVNIPQRIQDLSVIASKYLNLHFKAEAGIVNYYTKNSSLCFHTDHSELNHQAPLFSMSLGKPAVFLIGGQRKDSPEPIVPILLRDSDLVIMSGNSRLALHAVARIFPNETINIQDSKKTKNQTNNKEILRININIRQVF